MDVLTLPAEDWRAYRDLRQRALKEDPEAFGSSLAASQEQPDEYWGERLAEALRGEWLWLLFAKEGDKLVGMIGAFVDETAADTAKIVSVYVPKEERGKGISTRLMEEMLRVLSATSRFKKVQLAVNVNQLPALGLYRRFGFREVRRQPSETGAGETVEQILMEREVEGRGV